MKHLLTLCLIASPLLVRAQTTPTSTPVSPSAGAMTMAAPARVSADEKAVVETEKQRFAAQVSKDFAVLDKVLADDLIYTHSTGNTDGKQPYIQSIREGKSRYDAIEPLEQKVRIYGNTAVINGVCVIKATTNGETINTRLRYTDIYVKKGGQWQMVAWQSLRLQP